MFLNFPFTKGMTGMVQPTPRERFIAVFELRSLTGLVPHFELVFYHTMEAFGRVHPLHRDYCQWLQMEEKVRQLHRNDMADLYIAFAERFEHSAIFVHSNPATFDECNKLIEIIREKTGDRYFSIKHGEVTYGIPDGDTLVAFCRGLRQEPQRLKAEMESDIDGALREAERQKRLGGLDGFAL